MYNVFDGERIKEIFSLTSVRILIYYIIMNKVFPMLFHEKGFLVVVMFKLT